jgi:predicted GH43/DUF377 family glycosyl hydrolase
LAQYGSTIGTFLLDLDDPSNVLGRLRDPLLKSTRSEWEGNVPNVACSCGALLHDGELFIPPVYASVSSSVRYLGASALAFSMNAA